MLVFTCIYSMMVRPNVLFVLINTLMVFRRTGQLPKKWNICMWLWEDQISKSCRRMCICMWAGLCFVFNEFLKKTETENTALRPIVCSNNCNLQYSIIYNTLNFTCYRLSECKPPLHGSDPFFIPRHCTITKQVKHFSNSI